MHLVLKVQFYHQRVELLGPESQLDTITEVDGYFEHDDIDLKAAVQEANYWTSIMADISPDPAVDEHEELLYNSYYCNSHHDIDPTEGG